MREFPLAVCGLCEKVIERGAPRVHFGRKTYHGQCFVNHCKKQHSKDTYDEEADAMEERK